MSDNHITMATNPWKKSSFTTSRLPEFSDDSFVNHNGMDFPKVYSLINSEGLGEYCVHLAVYAVFLYVFSLFIFIAFFGFEPPGIWLKLVPFVFMFDVVTHTSFGVDHFRFTAQTKDSMTQILFIQMFSIFLGANSERIRSFLARVFVRFGERAPQLLLTILYKFICLWMYLFTMFVDVIHNPRQFFSDLYFLTFNRGRRKFDRNECFIVGRVPTGIHQMHRTEYGWRVNNIGHTVTPYGAFNYAFHERFDVDTFQREFYRLSRHQRELLLGGVITIENHDVFYCTTFLDISLRFASSIGIVNTVCAALFNYTLSDYLDERIPPFMYEVFIAPLVEEILRHNFPLCGIVYALYEGRFSRINFTFHLLLTFLTTDYFLVCVFSHYLWNLLVYYHSLGSNRFFEQVDVCAEWLLAFIYSMIENFRIHSGELVFFIPIFLFVGSFDGTTPVDILINFTLSELAVFTGPLYVSLLGPIFEEVFYEFGYCNLFLRAAYESYKARNLIHVFAHVFVFSLATSFPERLILHLLWNFSALVTNYVSFWKDFESVKSAFFHDLLWWRYSVTIRYNERLDYLRAMRTGVCAGNAISWRELGWKQRESEYSNLDFASDLATIAEFLVLTFTKQWGLLMLSVVSHFRKLESWKKLDNEKMVSAFVEFCKRFSQAGEIVGIEFKDKATALAALNITQRDSEDFSDEEPQVDSLNLPEFLKEFVPSKYKRTQRFSVMYRGLLGLMSFKFFGNGQTLSALLERYVPLEDMGAALAVFSGIQATLPVIRALATGNDVEQFFEKMPEVLYVEKATELLEMVKSVEYDQIEEWYKHVMYLNIEIYPKIKEVDPLVVSLRDKLDKMYHQLLSESARVSCRKLFERLTRGAMSEDMANEAVDLYSRMGDILYSESYNSLSESVRRELTLLRDKLDSIILTFTRGKRRMQPWSCVLLGSPGTGKTTLVTSLVAMLLKSKNIDFQTHQLVTVNLTSKYPVEANINPHTLACEFADIEAVQSEYTKRDLQCIGTVFQQFFDSAPFSFRAADLSKKGINIGPLIGITTCNTTGIKCGTEVEKLERRLSEGVVFDVYVVDEKGKKLKYEEFKDFSYEKRNSLTRFKLYNVVCEGFHVRFVEVSSRPAMDMAEFFNYCRNSFLKHCERFQERLEKFETAERCSCGVAKALHNDKLFAWCDCLDDPPVDSLSMPSEVLGFVPWIFACLAAVGAYFYGKRKYVELKNNVLIGYAELRSEALREVERYKQYLNTVRENVIFGCKMLLALFAGGLLVTLLVKYFTESTLESLSKPINRETVEKGSVVVTGYQKEENFPENVARQWNKVKDQLTTITVTKGVSEIDLQKLVKLNMINVTVSNTGHTVTFLLLNNQFAFGLRHFFPGNDDICVQFDRNMYRIERSSIMIRPDSEIVMFPHSFPVAAAYLYSKFPSDIVPYPGDISIAGERDFPRMSVRFAPLLKQSQTMLGSGYEGSISERLFINGDCMATALMKVQGSTCLVGFLCAGIHGVDGTYKDIRFAAISQRMIDEFLHPVDYPIATCPDINSLFTEDLCPDSLSVKSQFRNVRDTGHLQIIGTLPGGSDKFTSKFRRSKLYSYVSASRANKEEPGLNVEYKPPMKVNATMLDGEGNERYVSSVMWSFKNHGAQSDLGEKEVEAAVRHFCDYYMQNAGTANICPVTLETALFGDENNYISKIDLTTSCGPSVQAEFGVKDKKGLFEFNGENYILDERFRSRVATILEKLSNGVVHYIHVKGTHKDEVREASKVDVCKVRIFGVLDADFNLALRMLLIAPITHLLNNPRFSKCYGGMNAGSPEWGALAKELQRFNRFFDADFSVFDMSHKIIMLKAVAYFFYLLCRASGMYREEQLTAVYTGIYSVAYQIFILNKDVALKFGGLPSGVLVTLIVNSVINVLLMLIAWKRLYGSFDAFFDNVAVATVGDDNVCSVSDKYEEFNLLNLQVMYNNFGYIITPAKKDGQIQPYISFGDLTFVQRRFVFDEDMGEWLAPINENSIWKGIAWEDSKMSNLTTPDHRLLQVGENAQREYFLYGKQTFLKMSSYLVELYARVGLSLRLLSYEELREEWDQKRFKTFMC